MGLDPRPPAGLDLTVTLTASYQKIFSPVPAIGYFAQHKAFAAAQAAGEQKSAPRPRPGPGRTPSSAARPSPNTVCPCPSSRPWWPSSSSPGGVVSMRGDSRAGGLPTSGEPAGRRRNLGPRAGSRRLRAGGPGGIEERPSLDPTPVGAHTHMAQADRLVRAAHAAVPVVRFTASVGRQPPAFVSLSAPGQLVHPTPPTMSEKSGCWRAHADDRDKNPPKMRSLLAAPPGTPSPVHQR